MTRYHKPRDIIVDFFFITDKKLELSKWDISGAFTQEASLERFLFPGFLTEEVLRWCLLFQHKAGRRELVSSCQMDSKSPLRGDFNPQLQRHQSFLSSYEHGLPICFFVSAQLIEKFDIVYIFMINEIKHFFTSMSNEY